MPESEIRIQEGCASGFAVSRIPHPDIWCLGSDCGTIRSCPDPGYVVIIVYWKKKHAYYYFAGWFAAQF